MDDKVFKCRLLYDRYWLESLFVSDLEIIITFRKQIKIQENKIKSSKKLLSKLKKIGVLRITRRGFIDPVLKDRRLFEIKQSEIMELLDCQCYETGN
jgi:hypothetical protein